MALSALICLITMTPFVIMAFRIPGHPIGQMALSIIVGAAMGSWYGWKCWKGKLHENSYFG